MSDLDLSIVIPTYNEKENIIRLIPQLSKIFKSIKHEIVVVDDRSPDGTGDTANELASQGHCVRLVTKEKKEGIGAALRVGYDNSNAKFIASTDADLSFKPEDLKLMYDVIQSGPDLIVGNRHSKQSFYEAPQFSIRVKRFVSMSGNCVLRFMTRIPLGDFSGNFRIIRNHVWKKIETSENTNTILFEMILKTWVKRFRVAELPVSFMDRKYGQSKLNLSIEAPKFLIKLLTFLIRYGRDLYFRPAQFKKLG